jgi:hypothetical protein
MATKPINELDFAALKEQFIDFLRNQTQFKDYNFAGSNMNVLLDVLSYNTYLNNFYTNMAINEMFLDSAVLKNSVVSHAKELNYLPRSRVSSKAIVNVSIVSATTVGTTITIPRFTEFQSSIGGVSYTFLTDKVYLAKRTDGNRFVANNVEIFEGEMLTAFEKDGFFLEEDNNFKCNLANENVDINSIEVYVDDDATEGQNQFFYTPSVYGVEPTSKVFYLEPYFDDRYSVYFGRNLYGEQPRRDIDIKIQYRVCSGADANGAKSFTTTFLPSVTVTTVEPASGGAERETLSSIKFLAPKSLQVQERAITATDYEILLRQRFPEIRSVSAYGGDELDPPQFGRVAISVNLQGEGFLSDTSKNSYIRYLTDKTPLTIEPIFVDPEFIFVETVIDVKYSQKLTNKSQQELEKLIRSAISTYNLTFLDDFGETLRSSKLSAAIDSVDGGILGNELCVNPIIEYKPVLNLELNPKFKFETQIVKPYPYRAINGFDDFKPSIVSTNFKYRGILSKLQDDGNGNVQIISSDNINIQILNPSIGKVNYLTGEVRLINFAVESFVGEAIKIYAASTSADVTAPKSRILTIRDEDITIRFIETN